MRELGHVVQVQSPVHGAYWRHGALQLFSHSEQTFRGWEPLGGHTRPILRELGYSESDIETLINQGVAEAWPGEATLAQGAK
jgi:crotonobetainyl-CoA:carnitine CoA-transferase CaiB-like acyl-CoA transferase